MTSELSTAQPAKHPSPRTKASALRYLIFERPDLERVERFLTNFGLVVTARTDDALYLRGTAATPYCYRVKRAPRPRFVGFGLAVDSRAALEALALVEGAGPLEPSPHVGGGDCVVLTDPSGFTVEAIHGQAPAAELPADGCQVIKLGHVVLEVADFQATCAWHTEHFGFIPSDVQVLPDGSPAVVFLRLDLGDTPTDHHTLAIAQGFMPAYSHSAYEVGDAAAVAMGQRILRERGWKHAWGIGRHILGSQIFDYWNDPWGDKHEHYCEGDVRAADQPMGVHPASREAMAQWGQPMPSSFTRPKLTPGNVAAMFRNLYRSPDLSVKKLLTLARLFG
jgi:hypothetical protein